MSECHTRQPIYTYELHLTRAIRLESFDFSTMEKLFTQPWNWVIFCLLVVINTDVDATLFTKKVVVKSLYTAVSFNNLPRRVQLLKIYSKMLEFLFLGCFSWWFIIFTWLEFLSLISQLIAIFTINNDFCIENKIVKNHYA